MQRVWSRRRVSGTYHLERIATAYLAGALAPLSSVSSSAAPPPFASCLKAGRQPPSRLFRLYCSLLQASSYRPSCAGGRLRKTPVPFSGSARLLSSGFTLPLRYSCRSSSSRQVLQLAARPCRSSSFVSCRPFSSSSLSTVPTGCPSTDSPSSSASVFSIMADPSRLPSKAKDSISFLEILKKQIDINLQHHKPGKCPLTKKDILDLGQLQMEIEFQDDVHSVGITCAQLFHNTPPPILYEQALKKEAGSLIASSGALCVSSGLKTGRSPADKRIVDEPSSRDDVWWGKVNIPFSEKSYAINRERAVDFLNIQDQLYIVDAYAGWDPEYRIKVRVITTLAYHALFMQNMLVLPEMEELKHFRPDFTIYNAGCFPANRFTQGVTSQTSVAMHLAKGEMVILGTQYAGEMKKGILTLMMYVMPKRGQLPLHSSCNVGPKGDVTLFFGLSGTGKTTLSADPLRKLIGDDEHVWTAKGVFNIEGGCYAKCKDLSKEQEPEIWEAIRFGSVLENVIIDGHTREVDFTDVSITENTRCAYPLSHVANAKIPAMVDTHPSNIILLTCDAFGVLPPLSRLTPQQVMYHFISGYTSKMAGTEIGILEPTATFSACYGAPFLAMHPMVYAGMLAEKLKAHNAHAWLLNTGWIGGGYGMKEGKRIPLKYTRLMVDAIHDGSALDVEATQMPVFNLEVPAHIKGVPDDILLPQRSWANKEKLDAQIRKLASLFIENFKNYTDKATPEAIAAGPVLS